MNKTDIFSDMIKNTSIKDGIDLLYRQVLLTWDSEKRFLDWYGINKSKRILDVGCGPGFIIEKLYEYNNNAFITGIDLNTVFILQSKLLLSKKTDRIKLFAGDALKTNFPDNSFDFVYARAIFQHLPEPILLAKEIWRILEPGGKVAIFDVDEDLAGLSDPKLSFEDEMRARFKKYVGKSITNQKIGRDLPRILKHAGFINIKFDIIAIHSDLVGFELLKEMVYSTYFLQFVKAGIVTNEEAEEQNKQYSNFFASSESKSISLIVMVYGEKS